MMINLSNSQAEQITYRLYALRFLSVESRIKFKLECLSYGAVYQDVFEYWLCV